MAGIFGGFAVDSDVGAQLTNIGATPVRISTFGSAFQSSSMFADISTFEVAALESGSHIVSCQISFGTDTPDTTFTFRIFVKGVRYVIPGTNTGIRSDSRLASVNGIDSASLVGLVELIHGDRVSLNIEANNPNVTITVFSGQLILSREK